MQQNLEQKIEGLFFGLRKRTLTREEFLKLSEYALGGIFLSGLGGCGQDSIDLGDGLYNLPDGAYYYPRFFPYIPGLGPAWSPDGKKIAFTSGNQDTVYVMNSNGTELKSLTQGEAPAWSPDGSKIAFGSDRGGNYEIYMINSDGTNPVRLTDHPADDSVPSWSPDGKVLAFRTNRRDENPSYSAKIYTMDINGGTLVNLTKHSGTDISPVWSPDGKKIAFGSFRDGNHEVYVMNSDGTNQRNLTRNSSNDSAPAWSPDGSKIVYHSSRDGGFEIYVMNADDGTNQTRLTYPEPGMILGGIWNYAPAWSPDGKKIAFMSNRDREMDKTHGIYTMNPDGTDLTKLPFN